VTALASANQSRLAAAARRGAPLVAVTGSALLVGLAFPPASWTALMWVALVPLLVVIRTARLAPALALTALWSGIGAWTVGAWFPRSVSEYFLQPLPVAGAMFVAVVASMAGPYYIAFAFAYRVLARHFALSLPLLTAAAWVAIELGRGRLFTDSPFFIGNPWGLLGYSQVPQLALMQLASVTGIYGIGFCVVAPNVALAELVLEARSAGSRRWGPKLAALAVASLPALAAAAWGRARLDAAPLLEHDARAVPIAVVQGNVDVGSRWRSDLYGKHLGVYLDLTERAAREYAPALVVWPEAAMTFFFEDEPLYRRLIATAQRRHRLELIVGGPRAEGPPEAPRYFNSIWSLAPDGSIAGRYDKQYLVPFAEYFPLRIDLLRRSFGRVRVFERGAAAAPLPTRAGPAAVLICNEAMLPEVVARRVAQGAALLVNPSNDSWIDDPIYTEQQMHIALVRAIEQRRFLVRASTGGPSAVIDPWGRTLARTPSGIAAVLVARVMPQDVQTLYARVGDLFAALCLAVAATATGRASRAARRAAPDGASPHAGRRRAP
jgi:apolipoprotein N-acyltransferase